MLKKSKILVLLALVLIMSFANIIPAFAENEPPKEAAITKVLQVPFGTDIPEATFKFEIKAILVDSVNYIFSNNTPNMPIIGAYPNNTTGTGTISLVFGKSISAIKKDTELSDTYTDVWYLQTPNILMDVEWKHAGEYHYHIKESEAVYTSGANVGSVDSKAEYNVVVLVKEDNTGKFVVDAVYVTRIADDEGNEANAKVDPTPGDSGDKYSQLKFTNKYWKDNGNTTTDPDDPTNPEKKWTLSISKKVKEYLADETLYFNYSMKLHMPDIIPSNMVNDYKVYKAYIVEKLTNGSYSLVTSPNNNVTYGSGGAITVTAGEVFTFSLKHNQYLVFVNTTVGAYYEITEFKSPAYNPAADVISSAARIVTKSGGTNTDLTLSHLDNNDKPLFVGEAANSVDFVNSRAEIQITGLNLNDLPFIVLIALGLGGLVIFILAKSRKNKNYN